MLLYPDIQRKAQNEVDRVVGRDRLPDFSDEPSLPYVTALVKEVLRSVFSSKVFSDWKINLLLLFYYPGGVR